MARTSKLTRASLFGVFALIILACLTAGCSSGQKDETADSSTTMVTGAMAALSDADAALVKKAATIATAIETAPQTAAKVLAENGMSPQSFEDLIYKISGDEKLAAAYSEVRQ